MPAYLPKSHGWHKVNGEWYPKRRAHRPTRFYLSQVHFNRYGAPTNYGSNPRLPIRFWFNRQSLRPTRQLRRKIRNRVGRDVENIIRQYYPRF